ncbi:MAG: DUF3417 domain-containing protein, partial [Endomicrobium sp.]|nr:DUF3417 domain-containing protein [Endomicrobium sp.]
MKLDLFNEQQETFVSKKAKTFVTVPNLPEILSPLLAIADNMWWCWNSDAVELFRRLDRDLWEEAGHNPKAILGMLRQERLEKVASDGSFISHMERVKKDLEKYMTM